MELSFFICCLNNGGKVEICDFNWLVSFDSYLLNRSSNCAKMVKFER